MGRERRFIGVVLKLCLGGARVVMARSLSQDERGMRALLEVCLWNWYTGVGEFMFEYHGRGRAGYDVNHEV